MTASIYAAAISAGVINIQSGSGDVPDAYWVILAVAGSFAALAVGVAIYRICKA